MDENTSAEITNPGRGLTTNPFDNDSVRISGAGFRPVQSNRHYFTDDFGEVGFTNIQINEEEEHGENAAELDAAGVPQEFRLVTVLENTGSFSYTNTYISPRPLLTGDNISYTPEGAGGTQSIFDTIVGNSSRVLLNK